VCIYITIYAQSCIKCKTVSYKIDDTLLYANCKLTVVIAFRKLKVKDGWRGGRPGEKEREYRGLLYKPIARSQNDNSRGRIEGNTGGGGRIRETFTKIVSTFNSRRRLFRNGTRSNISKRRKDTDSCCPDVSLSVLVIYERRLKLTARFPTPVDGWWPIIVCRRRNVRISTKGIWFFFFF